MQGNLMFWSLPCQTPWGGTPAFLGLASRQGLRDPGKKTNWKKLQNHIFWSVQYSLNCYFTFEILCFEKIGWLACSLALVRVDAYCVAHFFTFHTFSATTTVFRTPQSCKFHLHRDFSVQQGFFPILSELIKKFVWLLRKLENTRLCWSLCSMSGTNASQPSSSIYDYRWYECHQHIYHTAPLLQSTRLARWRIWTNAAAMTIASSVKFLPLLEKVTHSIDILYREVETC